MDIDLLKTFVEVVRTRHFGKAAENLYITQSAVSFRIRQLEQGLGVNLFIRQRNNIQLTAEGERLVPHAETMLVAWSRARQDVALKLEQKHQINIGTTPGLWHYTLQGKLPLIQSSFPALALRAESHNGDELLRLLIERVLDIVLLYEAPTLPELQSTSLGKLKLTLITSAQDVSVKAALQSNYVYVDWGTSFGIFHAKKFGDAPPAILHTNMAYIAESFICENLASAYLPESLLDSDKAKNISAIKCAPTFSRNVYAVYRSNSERADVMNEIMPYLSLEK